jgi:NAD(P)-dependent dehydrogenase (short-subunit alcohol dehydrogenase family)
MSDPFRYAGRHVVVTGGATGVGAALLELLAELGGPQVTVLDIKAPPGPHTRFVETDLADRGAVDAAIAEIAASEEPVHALFNNAGVNSTAGVATTIGVNFLAPRRLAEGLLPRMPPGSAIVNTASSAGNNWAAHATEIHELLALDDWAEAVAWTEAHRDVFETGRSDVYFFSKEVVQLWTLRWAPVARRANVRVNSVCPAPIDTPLLADFRRTMSDEIIDWNIDQAGGRLMSPREVAMPLVFLGSEAASYISGVNLVIDNGFMAALTTGQLDFSTLTAP